MVNVLIYVLRDGYTVTLSKSYTSHVLEWLQPYDRKSLLLLVLSLRSGSSAFRVMSWSREFQNNFITLLLKIIGVLIGTVLNLYINFGRIDIFYVFSLPIQANLCRSHTLFVYILLLFPSLSINFYCCRNVILTSKIGWCSLTLSHSEKV